MTTPSLTPPKIAREWPYPAVVFLSLLALYAATTPRMVTFEDDGGFIMVAEVLGIAHPPGYPLWTLLGKLSTLLPLGTVAFRVHLLSGVLGALTGAVLWWITRTLTGDKQVSVCVALAYGASPVMWSQAIIAEVYTLNTLLSFGLLALALHGLRAPSRGWLLLMGFVYGLALCNHVPLVILVTPCLALVLWPRWREVVRGLPLALLGTLIGLLPYAWMVARSQAEPAISFYGPIRSLEEFIYYVGRMGYASLDTRTSASLVDKVSYFFFIVRESIGQYTIVGAAIAALGFVHQLRSVRLTWNLGMLAGYLSGGFVVAAMLNRDYQFLDQLIFRVYPLVSYGFIGIWIAAGLAWLRERAREQWGTGPAWGVVGLGACLALANLVLHIGANDRSDYRFADEYARGVLESLDRDAILFVETDDDVFPIGQLHVVEGVRPDVDLYHYEGLIFEPRLMHARDGTPALRQERARELIANTDRPVYFMLRKDLGYDLEDFGFYVKIDRSPARGELRNRVDPKLLDLTLRLADHPDVDEPWTGFKRDAVLANQARLLSLVIAERPDDPRAPRYREQLAKISERFLPALIRIRTQSLLADADPERLLEELTAITDRRDAHVSKRYVALHQFTRGELLVRLARDDEAEQAFQQSLRTWWDPSNDALMALLELYARTGRRDQYHALRSQLVQPAAREELMRLDRQAGY